MKSAYVSTEILIQVICTKKTKDSTSAKNQ